MDTKALIGKLNKVFCESSKTGKNYSQVWLADVDFGGLYHNDMFVLNVKADHEINSSNEEIKYVINLLNAKAKEELKTIWRVAVHNHDEEVHSYSPREELIVFDKATACP